MSAIKINGKSIFINSVGELAPAGRENWINVGAFIGFGCMLKEELITMVDLQLQLKEVYSSNSCTRRVVKLCIILVPYMVSQAPFKSFLGDHWNMGS